MNPNSNQNESWYPNGAPTPGQPQQTQSPPLSPAVPPSAVPPQQPYTAPVQPAAGMQPQPLAPPPQPNTPQYSIDYLNQIAPQSKKPGLDNRIFAFIIGGGLLLAVIVGFFALLSSGNGPTETMQTMAARMLTLQTISDKAQKSIKSGKLSGTNSSLTVFLTNANHDIVDPLMTNGVDVKKIDKKITAVEKGEDLTKKLEDARLNAVFDRTYAREMSYQLKTVESLMKTTFLKTKSKSLKAFLSKTDDNIAPIIKQLDTFNTTLSND